jgi:hypothetical protein
MTGQILKQSGSHVALACFKATLTFGAVIAFFGGEGNVGDANCAAHQTQEQGLPLEPTMSQKSGRRKH